MKVTKAVITTAGKRQRTLPLQVLVDRDGVEKPVLRILLEEVFSAGMEEVCLVVTPGDENTYEQLAGDHATRLAFCVQDQPRGYADALLRTREFVGADPFLHLVGDHLYVSRSLQSCARQLVDVAAAENCAISAVQATREHLLPRFGAAAGQRMPRREGLYRIETVMEKPTPTEAEQRLVVAGMRAAHYLCFFGMHVLTPTVLEILARLAAPAGHRITLSDALAELPRHEQYLAWEHPGRRYDLGTRYGILIAQLALALGGTDRDEVLSQLLELLAQREMGMAPAATAGLE